MDSSFHCDHAWLGAAIHVTGAILAIYESLKSILSLVHT